MLVRLRTGEVPKGAWRPKHGRWWFEDQYGFRLDRFNRISEWQPKSTRSRVRSIILILALAAVIAFLVYGGGRGRVAEPVPCPDADGC